MDMKGLEHYDIFRYRCLLYYYNKHNNYIKNVLLYIQRENLFIWG